MGYFNLSPQGDGNRSIFWYLGSRVAISTYPRKGTETPLHERDYELP